MQIPEIPTRPKTDKKLTDSEIVKGLEGMIQFAEMVDRDVIDMVDVQTLKNTLDLINRLQAENERLKNAYKQCAWERDNFQADNKRLYEIIENENIKLEEK